MREPDNERNDEKIEAHDIVFGAGKSEKNKPRGRVFRFFDNLWYHYKWPIIAALFIAAVLIVIITQCARRDKPGDVTLLAAGPYGFAADEAALRDLQNCLSTYLPRDFDGDGTKRVTLVNYMIYSEAEIEAAAARTDENGNPAGDGVNRAYNAEQYQQYHQYLRLGECAVLFLSPWLFEEQTALSTIPLADLSAVLTERPAGAIIPEEGSIDGPYYGVRLSETALWRDNSAVRNALPADTVICLYRPGIGGENSKPEKYAESVEYLKELVP